MTAPLDCKIAFWERNISSGILITNKILFMKKTFLFFTIAFLIIAITSNAQVTDIDGHQYKTVKIGKQVWMTENLEVSHFRNGDSISGVIDDCDAFIQLGRSEKPAWSKFTWPTDKLKLKYYNWYAIQDTRG